MKTDYASLTENHASENVYDGHLELEKKIAPKNFREPLKIFVNQYLRRKAMVVFFFFRKATLRA